MTNIWGVLLQSVEVSIVAILLLIIKELFRDKLSPSWQYHVWGILFVSIFIPVGILGTYLIPQVSIFIEMMKTMIERQLNSSYTLTYEGIHLTSVFPIIKQTPTSITDILFIIYVIGIMIILIKYLSQFIRLKKVVSNSKKANPLLIEQVNQVAKIYNLKTCNKIVVANIPSAFIFGLFRPTLVLPIKEIDNKVLLHELYHLKYKDSLQSTVWAIVMSLHWMNPLMLYVFNVIRNDIEILCDQRVLESIEGEQRRDYGRILLDMTNDSYPKAFCTTSISNGTTQIKKRIESIVRFKKYPKQMVLLSVCIAMLLTPLVFGGVAQANLIDSDEVGLKKEYALASARLSSCTTMAGAIDTFIKGVVRSNEIYLTAVLPTEKVENIQNEMELLKLDRDENYSLFKSYRIKNIEKVNKNVYLAYILVEEETVNDSAEYVYRTHILPIKITKHNGYHVELNGDIRKSNEYLNQYFHGEMVDFVPSNIIQEETNKGILTISTQSEYTIQQASPTSNDMFGNWFQLTFTDIAPNPNAHFDMIHVSTDYSYQSKETYDLFNVGIACLTYNDKANLEEFDEIKMGNVGGGNSNGLSFDFHSVNDEWDGILDGGSGDIMYDSDEIIDINHPYDGYVVRVYHNYELFEEIIIERETYE